MKDSGTSLITDKASLMALITGAVTGLSVALFRSSIVTIPGFIAGTQLQLVLILALSVISALVTVILARKEFTSRFHAPGEAGRLGIQAGVFCALWAGAVLTALATWDASGADSASLDRALRSRMWLVFSVSLAALLPSVLCGFVGGLTGGQVALRNWTAASADTLPAIFPWLRWVKMGVSVMAALLLASPISFLGRAPVIDPPPVVAAPSIAPVPPAPPPFRYDPPKDIKSAKIGEIQPDFTKVIPQVQRDCPVALSPDDVMVAFGDAAGSQPAIGIFDLHRFTKTASIQVPAFPHGNLSWSPDQKSIACTIGEGKSRRVWILRIAESRAIELPRPPGRDVPGGDLHWWQAGELAFFPDDEAPLAFDLDKLVLLPLEDSPAYKKLDDISKRLWKEGSRETWPGQKHWKLGVRTLITSAVPPSRREPDGPWQLSGQSVCAFTHPSVPISFGLKSFGVDEGDKILCSDDGSKLMRLMNGKIEVTFMKQTTCPDLVFEVEMPFPVDEIENTGWSTQVKDKQLCLMIYAPLKNPLNDRVVGPDYNQVRALARLLEWKGRQGVFIVQTHDGSVQAGDVASSLHYWEPGNMSEWKPETTRNWWTTIKTASSPLPAKLPELPTPQLLDLTQGTSVMIVTKAIEKPHEPPPQKVTEVAPPPQPPAPPPPPAISASDVKAFVSEHHAKASKGDLQGMIADYEAMVDFLDKGLLTRDAIGADEQAHRAKWPVGSEKIIGEIRIVQEGGLWQAEYTIEFYNENEAGEWHKGRADLTLRLKEAGKTLSITSQRAKVYDVTNSKQSPKAPAAGAAQQPQGVPISVPKPCFVAVTRAKDLGQIEFTDEISFAGTLTWHRTYRELSPDGKVVNVCRAIYEGNGGVLPNRQGARIYVGSQGWHRTMGTPAFVRLCERSAAALVGREFIFQFTQNGMIESNTGTTFKLVK